MSHTGRRLCLVMPGLLGPLPASCRESLELESLRPLGQTLGRARRFTQPGNGLEPTLFHLFGWEGIGQSSFPVAAVRRFARTGQRDDQRWFCADLVHLQADRDQALVFDGTGLDSDDTERWALAESLVGYFQDQGWVIESDGVTQWHLVAPGLDDTVVAPLAEVIGRDLHRYLPEGEPGRAWRGMLNEIQMLFHAHPVNRAREDRGEPMINGLWIWGGGVLPEFPQGTWRGVSSQESLAAGLAELAGATVCNLPQDADDWLAADESIRPGLVVFTGQRDSVIDGDWTRWESGSVEFQESWLAPLCTALRSRQLDTLEILPCNGTGYRVTRGTLRKFWRRPLDLGKLVAAG